MLTAPPPPDRLDDLSLLLDFDGTLVAIADAPDAIRVSPALPGLLSRLADALGGRLAIVSGRAVADIDRHLGAVGIAIAGSHGGEFRAAGAATIKPLAAPLPQAACTSTETLAARLGDLLVERKPSGIAVHYRSAPEAGPELAASIERIATDHGMTVKHGKMVAEMVMPGVDKGSAVQHLMQTGGFAGSRPIFVGDDITDEDAFRSVLDYDGGGILVGDMRETAARWHLPDVAAVHLWLEELLRS